jgi:hypothetical protein
MSATSGYNLRGARSYSAARQRVVERTLRRYGVLTRAGLRELVHADGWSVPLDVVLRRATLAGRIRRLSDDLYEAGAPHDD